MKRYMALIQKILEYGEEIGAGEWLDALNSPKYKSHVVHYHIALCHQAGYVEVRK